MRRRTHIGITALVALALVGQAYAPAAAFAAVANCAKHATVAHAVGRPEAQPDEAQGHADHDHRNELCCHQEAPLIPAVRDTPVSAAPAQWVRMVTVPVLERVPYHSYPIPVPPG